MTAVMLHPQVETSSEQDVERLQSTLWEEQWDYVRSRSDFYRAKLGGRVNGRLSLDDLRDIDFTDKEELRLSQ